MRYFKYNGSKKTGKIASDMHYRSLTKEERKSVRRDKFFNILALVVLFSVMLIGTLIFLFWEESIAMPGNVVLRVLCYIGKGLLTICGLVVSVVIGILAASPLFALVKGEAQRIEKRCLSEACNHLREYYGVCEPYVVTKCYDSTDENFVDHDVCIFVADGELRITVNLIHGFVYDKNDLGCYAFDFDEIEVKEKQNDRLTETKLTAGDTVFVLGRRAMGYIKSNVIDSGVNCGKI